MLSQYLVIHLFVLKIRFFRQPYHLRGQKRQFQFKWITPEQRNQCWFKLLFSVIGLIYSAHIFENHLFAYLCLWVTLPNHAIKINEKIPNWRCYCLFSRSVARKSKENAKQKFRAKEISQKKKKRSRSGAPAVIAPLPGFGRSKSGPHCRCGEKRYWKSHSFWWTFGDERMFWISGRHVWPGRGIFRCRVLFYTT